MLQADSWLTEPSGKSSKKLRWILLYKCLINIINDFNEKNSLHSSVSTDLRKRGILTLPWDCERLVLGTESLISAVRCQPGPFRCCPAPPRLPLPLRLHVRIPVFSPGPTGPFALFCTSFHPAFSSLCAAVWTFSSESESRSFTSNSLWPHGLYSPWNSPGKNIGVGSHPLLQGIFPT